MNNSRKIIRVEFGMRDYNNKIFSKVYTNESDEFELMMLKDDEDFYWFKHVATETADIPGGVLYPCCPNCMCFREILHPINIDEQVNRISAKYDANTSETLASMLLHAFRCKPHEAVERMETDSAEQAIHLAQNFKRKTKSHDSFEKIRSDTVLQLENHQ